MQTTVFEATKNSVVITHCDGTVITIRDGLTPKQAKQLAARLTDQAQDEEYKPTRREQRSTVHIEVDLEITSCTDQEEVGFYTIKEIEKDLKEFVEQTFNTDFDFGYQTERTRTPKVKVIVTKVYDKQVPNE